MPRRTSKQPAATATEQKATAPKLAPINVRVAHVLGEYTRWNTAYDLWAELLLACRDGHVPTLKTMNPQHVALGIALESQGCSVEWRS